MNVLIMMLLGGGVGAGLVLLVQALTPVSQPMDEVFESIEQPGTRFRATTVERQLDPRGAMVSIGRAITLGLGDEVQLRKDLAVTGSSLDEHAIRVASAPAITIVASYALWLAMLALGIVVNPIIITLIAMVGACFAVALPLISLRRRANEARIAFRHALSAYLDLVTIIMSGGGGLLTALQTSADSGDGWAFGEIRAALDRARLSGRTPWSQLGVLGERFDIPELRDLVAAAQLAGTEGARISESVATKSDVLRARLQAEVEQASESMTEQMLIPVGFLLVALFLFLGFAVFQQLGGGGARPNFAEDTSAPTHTTWEWQVMS